MRGAGIQVEALISMFPCFSRGRGYHRGPQTGSSIDAGSRCWSGWEGDAADAGAP